MKKFISVLVILTMLLSMAACGSSGNGSTTAPAAAPTTAAGTETPALEIPSINEIQLGTDYQDITATIKVLTNRTDIVDTVYLQ